ncbi:gliding motility protein GldL [Flavobacterium salilacus subsp. salilacus]|uniref:GldL-related protein n=1 Tax=Flavobacterium TaxID=237 RepID=UPI0010756ED7|nr:MULTISPECIES: gliding motility protein GldL [Flavobacterium]KAF2519216.1 gliding motility protein GldL [Flavobacterium salilacus subsp. salilacus]MBE1613396.1 gliding motility protein GldL [Flavobacterium sp. SaA2.13]
MKNWHIIIVFLISFTILVIGALFKLMHWPYASIMLTIGMGGKALAILLFIIKIVRERNTVDFLNK